MARNAATDTPSLWSWQDGVRVPRVGEQTGLYHRYVLTATWRERGLTDGLEKTYRLVSYKARLHEL
ncbi:MAG: hypothetical protein ACD_39C00143G0001 [uncultured bacterium]|nr:MAG: hypothetical protein ACD_39C00143G0001 [uncultured bacterium]